MMAENLWKENTNQKRINRKRKDIFELEYKSFDNLINIENLINIQDIINYITTNILSIIQKNKHMKKKPSKGINEPLYSKLIPVLTLEQYLVRIIKYTEIEKNTLITAYLYIIKLIKKENFILSINNIYRLLLGSVVLAKKVLEDIKYTNSFYCEIGGMSVLEFNKIEYSLFTRLNFDVNPKREEIKEVYIKIIDSLPQPNIKFTQIYEKF